MGEPGKGLKGVGAEQPLSCSRRAARVGPCHFSRNSPERSQRPSPRRAGLPAAPAPLPGPRPLGAGDHAQHRGLTRGDLHSPWKELPLAVAPQDPLQRHPQLRVPSSVSLCSNTAELRSVSVRGTTAPAAPQVGTCVLPWWPPPALHALAWQGRSQRVRACREGCEGQG